MTVPLTRRSRPLSTLLLLATAGLLSFPAGAEPPPAKPQPEPIYDIYASGTLALKAMEQAAIETNKRILANFGTNDCALCVTFASAMQGTRAFEAALAEQFFVVWIDVSPGSPNEQLLKANGIDASKGLPAVVVIDVVSGTSDFFREGEAAEAARKGPEAVRTFLLKLFRATPTK